MLKRWFSFVNSPENSNRACFAPSKSYHNEQIKSSNMHPYNPCNPWSKRKNGSVQKPVAVSSVNAKPDYGTRASRPLRTRTSALHTRWPLLQLAFRAEPKNPCCSVLIRRSPPTSNWTSGGFFVKSGGYLLSHGCAVPSAQAGLTSLFGMGRGRREAAIDNCR